MLPPTINYDLLQIKWKESITEPILNIPNVQNKLDDYLNKQKSEVL